MVAAGADAVPRRRELAAMDRLGTDAGCFHAAAGVAADGPGVRAFAVPGVGSVAIGVVAAFLIATQQSSVPLACALLIVLIPLQWFFVRLRLAPRTRMMSRAMLAALSPLLVPACAIAALVTVNAVGFGRLSVSPYGNVFVLARVIYDGPGMAVLWRDCPDRGWVLCPYLDRFPPSVDAFLLGARQSGHAGGRP